MGVGVGLVVVAIVKVILFKSDALCEEHAPLVHVERERYHVHMYHSRSDIMNYVNKYVPWYNVQQYVYVNCSLY